MITSNIDLGTNVSIDNDASINNVKIGDNTKIAAGVRVFGSPKHQLVVGKNCYFGPNTIVEGYNAQVTIGNFVSFAQNINLMSGSGPNASETLQRIFPIIKGEVHLGDHTWIGASVVIMPNVTLGKFCIVAANSFVNKSFPDYSIIGGSPAKLIRILTKEEIEKLHE
ncbi:MAG: DapH/DapD/GlmU-related protein [Flavobacterium sp.]|jgi:acetyltransferase-like isoleucine patch superfamily enzyme|uniref:acyltransferase n=1 Tax=Flavobacterium sp. TaxID=239 RepID=UPI002D111E20|nr:DapH/DapD/GlmU-related protein [Flavobacterium sp.]MCA0349646.1 acyltransferase [Bacteroidota bacterium]HQA75382.1 DapH/DapD/GlmU-related protein [Flavobacterium sp.]